MYTKLLILALTMDLFAILCQGCTIFKEPEAKNHHCDGKMYNGNCYKLVSTHLNFPRAQISCRAWGGYLTDIGSVAENNFLNTLASEKPWIGLTNMYHYYSYSWTIGRSLSYTNWFPGLPPDPSKDNNTYCAYIVETLTGKWSIYDCNNAYLPFICKKMYQPEEVLY